MKIVSLEIKKIGIGKFFPKEKKAELHVMFNDGSDKEILKTVDISDSVSAADTILLTLRKMQKRIHKDQDSEKSIIDNFVNIVIKDEENLIKEISQFVQKIEAKLEEINSKKEAEGYLDSIRELKNLSLRL